MVYIALYNTDCSKAALQKRKRLNDEKIRYTLLSLKGNLKKTKKKTAEGTESKTQSTKYKERASLNTSTHTHVVLYIR